MIHAREDYNRIQDPENKIPEDEPVFLIRGQDMCALAALEAWCHTAKIMGVDQVMIDKVYKHMDRMVRWQDTKNMKVPDLT